MIELAGNGDVQQREENIKRKETAWVCFIWAAFFTLVIFTPLYVAGYQARLRLNAELQQTQCTVVDRSVLMGTHRVCCANCQQSSTIKWIMCEVPWWYGKYTIGWLDGTQTLLRDPGVSSNVDNITVMNSLSKIRPEPWMCYYNTSNVKQEPIDDLYPANDYYIASIVFAGVAITFCIISLSHAVSIVTSPDVGLRQQPSFIPTGQIHLNLREEFIAYNLQPQRSSSSSQVRRSRNTIDLRTTMNRENRITTSGKLTEPCALCLENDVCIETLSLPCGHSFHKKCVDQWTRLNPTCPLCRSQTQTDVPAAAD